MMQQHAAPINIVMERFRKLNEKDEKTKHNPPTNAAPNNIVCSLKQSIRYFTNVPPKIYPKALQKNTNE